MSPRERRNSHRGRSRSGEEKAGSEAKSHSGSLLSHDGMRRHYKECEARSGVWLGARFGRFQPAAPGHMVHEPETQLSESAVRDMVARQEAQDRVSAFQQAAQF